MADISATAGLDAREFSQGLQDALKAARAWKQQTERALKADPLQKATRAAQALQKAMQQVRAPKIQLDTSAVEASLERTRASANGATQAKEKLAQAVQKAQAASNGAVQAQTQLATAQANTAAATATAGKQVGDVEASIRKYRDASLSLRNEIEAGVITQEEGIRLAKEIRDESIQAAQGVERWSKQYRDLLVASGRADRTLATLEGRTTKLGLSQNVAIGTSQQLGAAQQQLEGIQSRLDASTNALVGGYRQLAGAITAALAAAGLGRLIRSLTAFATESDNARTAVSLFLTEVRLAGGDVQAATSDLEALARGLQTTSDVVADAASDLMRFGVEQAQAFDLVRAGAAAALDAGVDLAQGIDAVTQAILSGRDARLRELGFVTDLARAEAAYANEVGKSRQELTRSERVTVAYTAVMAATGDAIGRITDRQRDFSGRVNDLNTALANARQNIGDTSQVLLGPLFDALKLVVNLFNALPKPLQAATVATTTLAVGSASLAIAYAAIRGVLTRLAVRQTLGNALLGQEVRQRGILAASLITLAGRYRILTAEQVKNALSATTLTGRVTLLNTAWLATRAAAGVAIASVRAVGLAIATALGPAGLIIAGVTTAVGGLALALKLLNKGAGGEGLGGGGSSGGRETDLGGLRDRAQEAQEAIERLTAAAADLQKRFSERFLDQELAFMPDGLDKDIERVRIEFRRLREEIQQAADTNEVFARSAAGLLSQAYANEFRAIRELQERYRAEELARQQQFSTELETFMLERSRAIADASTRGIQTEAEARTTAFQRAIADTSNLYDNLITRAREHGRDTTQLERQRLQNLKALQEEYARDITSIWNAIYDQLDARARDRLREALQGAGDPRALALFDYQDALRASDDFYRTAITNARGNTELLAAIEADRIQDSQAAWEAYWGELSRITSEQAASVLEREQDLARRRALLAGDARAALQIEYARELRALNDRYDTMERRAGDNAAALVDITRLRNAELAVLNEELARDLQALADDARATALKPLVSDLTTQLSEASRETVRAIERQLNAWMTAYGANGEIATLVQAGLQEVATAYARLDRDAARAIDSIREREGTLARDRAQAAGETGIVSRIDLDAELAAIEERYAALEAATDQSASALASIERARAAEIEAARAQHASNLQAIDDRILEREEALARARAELAGDTTEVARIDFASELARINSEYDALEAAALGNATRLERIARARNEALALLNEEYARELNAIVMSEETAAFQPRLQAFLADLEDASTATTNAVRDQLLAWRAAYGANGSIVQLIDAALDRVNARLGRLAEDAAQHLSDLVTEAARLTSSIRADDATRGLSDLERTLYTASERMRSVREQQAAITAALATAVGQERERLLEAARGLDDALEILTRNATADAISITEAAVREYERGLEDARERAGRAAVDAVTGDVRNLISNLVDANARALERARVDLTRLLVSLTAAGAPRESLQQIDEYLNQVTSRLERHALALADFASNQFALVRRAGDALLSEREARALTLATLQAEVRLREQALQRALELAQAQQAGAQDALDAQAATVNAQLNLKNALEDTISVLERQRASTLDAFRELPTDRLEGLEAELLNVRDAFIEQVEAAQAAGATLEEYAGVLRLANEANDLLNRVARERVNRLEREANAVASVTRNEERLNNVRRAVASTILQTAAANERETALEREQALTRESIRLQEQRLQQLRELAREYARVGDQQRAVDARDQMVSTSEAIINALQQELTTLRALQDQYRSRADAIRSLRDDVRSLTAEARGDTTAGRPASVREELERLRVMQAQGASLEEQRQQFERIRDAATAAREEGRDLTFFDRQDLETATRVFEQQAHAEEALNRDRERATRAQADAIERDLGAAVQALSADVRTLNELLQSTLDTTDTGLEAAFEHVAREAAAASDSVRALNSELDALRAAAAQAAADAAETIGLQAFQLDPEAALDALLDALPTSSLEAAGREAGEAYATAFQESLANLDATLKQQVGDLPELASGAEAAGERAGAGLMSAFAAGVNSNRGAVLEAVDRALADVRARLPSSDAKIGPLSDLTASGRTFFPTWMRGVMAGHESAVRHFEPLLRSLTPTAAVVWASRTHGGGAGAFGPAIGTLNIDGRPTSSTPGPLAIDARRLATRALNELAIQRRMRGE